MRTLRDSEPCKFLSTLTKEIATEGNPPQVRQMAALIFRNFILNKNRNSKYADFWLSMNVELKTQMKEAFLGTLASSQKTVRSSVANLIAAIASIEIPRNEWPTLLQNLSTNSSHGNFNIRLTALTSLGYICEEVPSKHFKAEECNSILYALTSNMSNTQTAEAIECTTAALSAFIHCTGLCSDSFKR